MIFHENRLPGDVSHQLSCLICYFLERSKICNCRLLQIIGGALWVYAAGYIQVCFRLEFIKETNTMNLDQTADTVCNMGCLRKEADERADNKSCIWWEKG